MSTPSGPARRALRLDDIVEAARAVIADEGPDRLTMRRVAQRCGVGVMTLYGYVRTKDELLAALDDQPPAPRGTAHGETFERIVDHATELIREDGVEGLTMRGLADQCGMGVMTLYGYVRTKEEILAAVADRFLAEIEIPGAEHQTWQDRIFELFGSLYRVLLAHPELARIAVVQSMDGAAAYQGTEAMLGALREAGFDDRAVVDAFDALISYTTGFALRELALTGSPSADRRARHVRDLPEAQYPHLHALAPVFAGRGRGHHFETGLRLLIAGIGSPPGGSPH